MAGDADFDKVALLLHMDGANGSTAFTDSSPTPKTITRNGNAQITTAQSKFGVSSAYFDGDGDFLSLNNVSEFDFGTSDFTIEAWVYIFAYPAIGSYRTIVSNILDSPQGGWRFLINSSGRLDNISAYWSGVAPSTTKSPSAIIPLQTWVHVAVSRVGDTIRSFVNGVLDSVMVGAANSAIKQSTRSDVVIGKNNQEWYFDGCIDELRITRGFGRYTENFTPPTAPFPDRAPQLSGNVKNASSANAARLVRAVREDTGAFVGSATSDAGTGNYTIVCSSDGAHSLIAYPAAGEDLPALVHHGVIPV